MIAMSEEAMPLDAYARETLQRVPLADATLSLWAHVLAPPFMAQVFAEYRGRSFEDTLTFARFVELIGDALLTHDGSGHGKRASISAKTQELCEEGNGPPGQLALDFQGLLAGGPPQ
jgi:hypothetical protein